MKKGFSFNLLPPKSKESIKQEEEKFSTLFYSLVLLFAGVFVWIIVVFANFLFVQASYKKSVERNTKLDQQISSYLLYVIENGELVTKTNMLEGVVLKHTDPSLVFEIIDTQIKQTVPNAVISRYGRSQTGNYQVTAQVNSLEQVFSLIKAFSVNSKVNDVTLVGLSKSDNENYSFVLDLDIIQVDDEQ